MSTGRSALGRAAFGRAVTLVAFCCLAAACGGGQADPGGPGPTRARAVPVEVRSLEPRTVTWTLQAVGSLEAREIIRIPARVAGVVQDVHFEAGTAVRADQVLARVDPERYLLAAEQAGATVRETEARAREAEAALAKRQGLRKKDPGWITDEELAHHVAALDEARAALEAARAARDLAGRDQEDSEIRAGAAGIINEKLVHTGQHVTAGMPVATMVDDSRLRLVFRLADSEAARLPPDAMVSFRVRARPDREFTARLYHVGRVADPATRMVDCMAWVETPGRELRAGTFADISVDIETRAGALVVPQTAVLPTDRGFVAWLVGENNLAEERGVRLGLYTRGGEVEVLDGLSVGDRVVVRGASLLAPGVAVEVTPPTGDAAPGEAAAP